MNSDATELTGSLPPLRRLALAYAPVRVRVPMLALLALDQRLSAIARNAREPMLAQIRLAWWREVLVDSAAARASGEPLIRLLDEWGERAGELTCLIDAWELAIVGVPLDARSMEGNAQGRGQAFAALAGMLGHGEEALEARRMGHNWALADLAARLDESHDAQVARELLRHCDWTQARLGRDLRPLAVLHGLAARGERRGGGLDRISPLALLPALRIGLFGR